MTQLIYHPAFDPYNSLLRAIRLLMILKEGAEPITLRLLDFYLLFPDALHKIRLTPQLRSAVKKLQAEPRFPYDRLPSPRILFERMAPSFEAALQTMGSRGLLVRNDQAHLLLRKEEVPTELLELASEQNENEIALMKVLQSLADEFPAHGPNGLKDRSGLVEFRYDVV